MISDIRKSSGATHPPVPDVAGELALRKTRLGEISGTLGQGVMVSADDSLSRVLSLFEADANLVGVLMYRGREFAGVLSRGAMYATLSRAFQRELYLSRPVGLFHEEQVMEMQETLDETMPLHTAVSHLIDRPLNKRYEPAVVRGADGRLSLLDVRDLIGQQCGQLQKAIRVVEQQHDEAYRAARVDRLTGLANRKAALERLESSQVGDHEVAVLFMDFDRFKLVNDSLGHDAGDELLVSIANRMAGVLAEWEGVSTRMAFAGRTVATMPISGASRIEAVRLGGDEFVVIVDPVAQPDEPAKIAERLLTALRRPHEVFGKAMTSTPSIGCTSSVISGRQAATLLRDADTAMYRAKEDGRNRLVVFESSMHQATARRAQVEAALRESLDRRELTLHYQPIIEVESGRLKGFECLCRWEHPELGKIAPIEFIPLAEEAGLIDRLGRQCLEEAARQLAVWRDQGVATPGLYLSVNVSKRQLLVPDMIEHLERTLTAAGLPRSALALEITETALGDSRVPIRPVLVALRRLGYRLMIDDFGTGTSSLTSLHDVPADVLKIDRGFILHMQRDHSYTAIVDAVVNLARNLHLEVIAEGIEEPGQFSQVQSLGCHAVQGYLFSPPLSASDAESLLRRGGECTRQWSAA